LFLAENPGNFMQQSNKIAWICHLSHLFLNHLSGKLPTVWLLLFKQTALIVFLFLYSKGPCKYCCCPCRCSNPTHRPQWTSTSIFFSLVERWCMGHEHWIAVCCKRSHFSLGAVENFSFRKSKLCNLQGKNYVNESLFQYL
jgi:hypothetical protein